MISPGIFPGIPFGILSGVLLMFPLDICAVISSEIPPGIVFAAFFSEIFPGIPLEIAPGIHWLIPHGIPLEISLGVPSGLYSVFSPEDSSGRSSVISLGILSSVFTGFLLVIAFKIHFEPLSRVLPGIC